MRSIVGVRPSSAVLTPGGPRIVTRCGEMGTWLKQTRRPGLLFDYRTACVKNRKWNLGNIYAVQQDTRSVLMSEFIQHLC